jgi:hypothetical protein
MRELLVVALVPLFWCAFGGLCGSVEFVKLTTFAGYWRGVGTDRALPMFSLQQTTCGADVNASISTMKILVSCTGEAGLSKEIEIEAAIVGDEITGNLSQKTTLPIIPSTVVTGAITGHRGPDFAVFDVVPDFFPKVAVTLQAQGTTSFTLYASMGEAELMSVSFHRSRKP